MTIADTPIIIVGAARSGTNILRDVLTGLPGLGTWPCDEINYIWRHGNAREPDDEFGPEMAGVEVRRFIRNSFERQARRGALDFVVEKTCANSLRLDFVDRIFPEARYVYLVRDGRDVTASAIRRWNSSLDLPYTLRKARFVPWSDLPYYASRYIWNRMYQLASGRQRLAFWGPRFKGMDTALREYPLAGVCALQWSRSVQRADEVLDRIDANRTHRLTYETFVIQPAVELHRLSAFLGITIPDRQVDVLAGSVFAGSVGRWKMELQPEEQALVQTLAGATLEQHGYR
jgi:hypothetical protein